MENSLVKLSLDKLCETIKSYKEGRLDKFDSNMIRLLQEIIVVEKDSATAQILYNQLKESYFRSDLLTANFILKLYGYDSEALNVYLDIYLEQVFENSISSGDASNKIYNMRNFLHDINPNLVEAFNTKIVKYNSEMSL